ncbi:hypothetical protein FA039_15330 [Escherichia coli]|nr:hypothetical protein [Escherichia coli]
MAPVCPFYRSGKEKRYLRRCMPRLMRRLSQPNPRQLPGNSALEKQVAELWQSLLSRPVARHHDFSNWAATA